MKQTISVAIIGILFLGSGCLPPKTITQTESNISLPVSEYSFDIEEGKFNIGLNPPEGHVVLGPFSLSPTWSLERKMLEICPEDAASKNKVSPEVPGSGLACEDAWIWIFAGDIETEQIIGNGPTSTTTPKLEKTHGQNTGLEFILGYSGQKVFIFKKFGYTFAVFDERRFGPEGLPQDEWEAMLDSILVTEK